MKVNRAICIEDYAPAPEEDASFVLKRGHEYTISPENDGEVCVFSTYWVHVPARLFAGVLPLASR